MMVHLDLHTRAASFLTEARSPMAWRRRAHDAASRPPMCLMGVAGGQTLPVTLYKLAPMLPDI
jgi:hypothetical protein